MGLSQYLVLMEMFFFVAENFLGWEEDRLKAEKSRIRK
jgi:hypothetical protein